jgi:hypothetical protein
MNVSLVWVDRYLKTFRNIVKLACVLEEPLKITVSTKYCNSSGELISEFPFPTLGDICRIISDIFCMLRAFTHCFEVTDRHLTKTLTVFIHLLQ